MSMSEHATIPPYLIEAMARLLYLADYETGREGGWLDADDDIQDAYRQTILAVVGPFWPTKHASQTEESEPT